MRVKRARACVASVLIATLAACGGTPAEEGSRAPGEKVTLTLQTFGGGENFGYKDLVGRWNKEHPNVQVNYTNLTDQFEDEYWPRMLQWLESGKGAGDVIGIEEGGMGLAKARPQYFTDLGEYGLDRRKADFPDWKWQNGINADGKLFALGTDVGGMAMCYRRDMFEKAGLPADRDEVSALWPDWESFVGTGRRFKAKNPGKGDPKFVDSLNQVFNVRLFQEAANHGNVTYFDQDNKLIVDSNPAVKTAFDFAQTVADEGLTAKVRNFTPEWDQAFKKDAFATLGCPSWMLGVVSEKSGKKNNGRWDVAAVPGGGGNWGGSWLAVPRQSEHPKEAADLLNFLTSKEGHVSAFKVMGGIPSSIPGQRDPEVTGLKDEYFNNAPKGEIFAKSAAELQPVFLGEKHAQVRAKVEDVIAAMDQGQASGDDAWRRFVEAAQREAR